MRICAPLKIYTDENLYQRGIKMSHFTPLHIENAQSVSPRSLITAPEGGVLNVQRCNSSRV